MNFGQNVFPRTGHVGPFRFPGLFSASRRGCELLLTLALLSTSICDAASIPSSRWVVSETDDQLVCREPDGNEVTLAKRPKRVVIAYGSLVGVWYCAGGTAVGITEVKSRNALPLKARELPTIGGIGSPNTETILALEPDLVLLMDRIHSHRALREILMQNRIENVMLEYENYTDFIGLTDLFQRLIGNQEKGSSSLLAKIQHDVGKIVKRTQALNGPRFLSLIVSTREVSVETTNANTAKIAEMLGGRNIAAEFHNPAGDELRLKLNPEQILIEDPDLVLVTSIGDAKTIQDKMETRFRDDEIWRNLRAVHENRVFFLPNDLFLYKANERFPEAFRYLAERMYPGKGLEHD